jgi:hypothetical protein
MTLQTMAVSEELYKTLLARYHDGVVRQPHLLDANIAEFITRVNDINGIVTTFCCEGHTRGEKGKITKMENHPNLRVRGYVTFAVRGDHLSFIDVIHQFLMQYEEHEFMEIKLILSKLSLMGVTRNAADCRAWYPVFLIEFFYKVNQDRDRSKFRKILSDLNDHIDRHYGLDTRLSK